MAEPLKIVLPHGGYRKLTVYDKSETIYQATVLFCRRFCRRMAIERLIR